MSNILFRHYFQEFFFLTILIACLNLLCSPHFPEDGCQLKLVILSNAFRPRALSVISCRKERWTIPSASQLEATSIKARFWHDSQILFYALSTSLLCLRS